MRFRRAKARMFKWALMNDRKAFVQVGHAVTVCKQNKITTSHRQTHTRVAVLCAVTTHVLTCPIYLSCCAWLYLRARASLAADFP